jgi:hypothetical protein
MNKRLENRLTMYEGLLALLRLNEAKTRSIAPFAEAVAALEAIIIELKQKSLEVDIVAVGKLEVKCGAAEALEVALLAFCSAIYILGRKLKDVELQQRVNISETKLRRMRDTELASFGTAVYDLARSHAEPLAGMGLTAEKIADLRAKVETFSASIGAREVSVVDRKGARGSMNELFDKADELIHEELDHYMQLLRSTETEFYNKYFAACVVKDTGVRHRPAPAEPTPAAPAPAVTSNGEMH